MIGLNSMRIDLEYVPSWPFLGEGDSLCESCSDGGSVELLFGVLVISEPRRLK